MRDSGNWNPDWTAVAGSGATTTSHVVTGLTNETAYEIELRAVNAFGAGPASSTEVTPMADPMPAFIHAESFDLFSHTVGTSIEELELPEAVGGNAPLEYSLTPDARDVGLTFDYVMRTLSGTPSTSQIATTYTWTATDSDETDPDHATLTFALVIAPAQAPTPTPTATAGGGAVTLSWPQPADPGITGWEVHLDGRGAWRALTPTERSEGGIVTLSGTVDGVDQRHGARVFHPRGHRQRCGGGVRRGVRCGGGDPGGGDGAGGACGAGVGAG